MTVTTVNTNGNLTTTPTNLLTGSHSSETVMVRLINSGGSTRVVTLYELGLSAADIVATITLQAGYFATATFKIGTSSTIGAVQDAGSDVNWTIEDVYIP